MPVILFSQIYFGVKSLPPFNNSRLFESDFEAFCECNECCSEMLNGLATPFYHDGITMRPEGDL